MSVKRAQREIDSAEFAEWMAYDRLDPIGQWRDDLRMAILASTIANAMDGLGQLVIGVAGGHPSPRQPFTIEDFLPSFDHQPLTPDDEDDAIAQQEAFFEGFTRTFGGAVQDG